MNAARPLPNNEQSRLAALRQYNVLDTPPEVEFDEIAQIAAALCGTPMAVLTLVDENRQWFKSRVGLEVEQTSRDVAFCAWTVMGTAPFVVQDAATDPRFSDNPLVCTSPNIRFYAGVPLLTSEGYSVGSLAVLDSKPREISGEQLDALRLLSRSAIRQLELRRSSAATQSTLESLLDAAPAGILSLDRYGRVLAANATARALLSLGAEPTIHSSLGTSGEQLVRRILAGEEVHGADINLSANARSLRIFSRPLFNAKELAGAIVVVEDLTERNHLEEQLRHAQKMEAVGRLAGGIAHDFNNLLNIIIGYTSLTSERVQNDETLHTYTAQTVAAAERAAQLTRQLLTFSRKKRVAVETLDLNTVIADWAKMLPRLIGEDIELSIEFWREAVPVTADRGQIEQVLMNLVINSRDAMPHGGKLEIKTATANVDAELAKAYGVAQGTKGVITIRDSGCGMSEEVRSKAFEPFFTTKDQSKGTGLGLAIVYGIVRQNGGFITVESAPECGTTFAVYLPLGNAQPEPRVPIEQGPRVVASGTVLVVEDEASLRDMIHAVLSDRGYRVSVAENGERALEVLQEHSDAIDLVVSDVVMPGMRGQELAARVAQLRPDIKILLMSGYIDDEMLATGADVLVKPFTPFALAQRIRDLLQQ